MIATMRPQRTGTYTSDGRFKTTRQYIGPDGLPVRKEFVQRLRAKETARQVTLRGARYKLCD